MADIQLDIVGSYDKLSDALDGAAGHVKSWGATLGNIFGDVGKAAEDLGERGRSMGIGLSSAGLQGEAALARMAAGANALQKSFVGAAAPVAIFIAAIAGIAVVGEYLKNAVEDASALQDEMIRLGGTLAAMGEHDVAVATKQVQSFAKTLSQTSVFTQTELIGAFQRLRPLVASNGEAYRLLQIAMDLSGRTGWDLAVSIHNIETAHAGFARQLGYLGIVVKDVHGKMLDFDTIMQHTATFASGGASEAASTLSGKWQNVKNRFAESATELGTDLLPALTNLVDFIHNNVVATVQEAIVAFIDLGTVIVRIFGAIEHPLAAIGHIAQAARDVLHGAFGKVGDDVKAAVDQMKALKDIFTQPLPDYFSIFGQPDAGPVPAIPKHVTNPEKEPKAKDTSAKTAADALKTMNDAWASILDEAARRVEQAKNKLDEAKAKLEAFRSTLDPDKAPTIAQVLTQQKLLHTEAAADKEQQHAIVQEIAAQKAAAEAYGRAAAAVSPHLTNHVQLVSQMHAEQRKHMDAVEKLLILYTTLGGNISKVAIEIQKMWRTADAEAAKRQKQALEVRYAPINEADRRAEEDVRTRAAIAAQRPGGETTQEKNQFDIEIAAAALAIAKHALAMEQDRQAIDLHNKQVNSYAADAKAVADADFRRIQAENQLTIAENKAAHDWGAFGRALNNDLGPVIAEFTKLRDELGKNTLGTFESVLQMVIERSQALRAFLEIIGNLFVALSRILDAVLIPIIKALDKVLTFVVNIFIELWNGVAAFLNLLGIHVYYIQKLNTLFGNLDANVRPLLDIIHDLPNISEYKSGKFGQLTPDIFNTGINQLQNGLVSPLNKHTSILQALAGLAILAGVYMLIANALHAAHAAISSVGFAGVIASIGLTNTILWSIFLKPSFLGFQLCPEVDQSIETRERGFIRAGDLKVGDYLRDPEDGWNRVNSVSIRSTTVYRFTTEVETIGVNEYHSVKNLNGQWVEVRLLKSGDKIMRYPNGELTIQFVECVGPGMYASIDCDRHRYVLGTSVGHNDSGQSIVAALHTVAAANGAAATRFRGPSTGTGIANTSNDNSNNFVQNIDTINVQSAADLRSIRENLSFDAERLFRTRQYSSGSY